MPIPHTVQNGECLSSIAFQYGFFVSTIWDDPDNAQLRGQRKDHNILKESAFQRHHGLQDCGEADEATRNKLVQESGG
jgi:hypothetical protein